MSEEKKRAVTVGDVVGAFDALKLISEEKFNIKTGQKLVKLTRWVQPVVDEFMEFQAALLKRLGNPVDGKPGTFEFSSEEKRVEYTNTLKERLEQTMAIPEKFKLSVNDLSHIEISAKSLLNLECVLVDLE